MCTCKQGISNTGTPNCTSALEVPVKLFVQSLYNNTGALNMIDLSTVTDPSDLDDQYFADWINNPDKSVRLFPLPKLKNVENSRGENRMETFKDGSKFFIGQGTRTFKAYIVGKDATPQLAGQLEDLRCTDFGIYLAGTSGSFIGSDAQAGFLKPINIEQDSFTAKFIPATDDAVQKIEITFDFDITEYDKNLRSIIAEEMTCDVRELRGLLDVSIGYYVSTVNYMQVELETIYGTALNHIPVEGLVTADFISSDTASTGKVYNVTDDSDVTITAVETTTAGSYILTFSTPQASGDHIQVMCKKNGFDFSGLIGHEGILA